MPGTDGGRADILLVGEAVAPTGYSRVLRGIFEPMAERWRIRHLAPRYEGSPHDYPWPLDEARTDADLYGFARLPELIRTARPRLVFVLSDLSYQARYMKILREIQGDFRIVAYSPVEAGPVAPETVEALEGLDLHVLYTEFGRREVAAAQEALGRRRPDFVRPRLEVIPHGVDTRTFRPSSPDEGSRRVLARRQILRGFPELEDAFIVLNASRNQPRKQIDITMKGFALFARDKPENVKLYLHMAVEERGWNLMILGQRLGLDDRLILATDGNRHPELSSGQLNLLYNACDVGLNTSSAEGWGLVSFEHGATRAAQIVPGHTSQTELWEGAAELLEPVLTTVTPGSLHEAFLVSPEGVAAALERLYADPGYRQRMAARAFENANRPEYRWEGISRRWESLLLEVLG